MIELPDSSSRRCTPARAVCLSLLVASGASCAQSEPRVEPFCHFTPDSANPMLEPPDLDTILGDPSVLTPAQTPDRRWHLFANTIFYGILHYVSGDGVSWEEIDRMFGLGAVRPYVFYADGEFALYFEQYQSFNESNIEVTTSPDLVTWSSSRIVLEPEVGFEIVGQERVGNPFVVPDNDQWRLYYSGGGVLLEDSEVFEPYRLGRATSSSPLGPWQRDGELTISIDVHPREALSWGSLKVLPGPSDEPRIAYANMLFRDDTVTGSAIYSLTSEDGMSWEAACPDAVIEPSGTGWDAAYVYGFDLVPHDDQLLIYANGRDGYEGAVERIGRYLSVAVD